MRARPRTVCAAALAAVAAALGAGCAGGSAQPGARTFLQVHETEAVKAAAAVATLRLDAEALAGPGGGAARERLVTDAAHARRALALTSEWPLTATREEEDLERAQAEIVEASRQLLSAAAALRSFARGRDPSGLVRWRSDLSEAREKWNGAVSQLWYLDGRHGAPTI